MIVLLTKWLKDSMLLLNQNGNGFEKYFDQQWRRARSMSLVNRNELFKKKLKRSNGVISAQFMINLNGI